MTKEAFIQTILEKISQSGGNGRVEIREMIKRNGAVRSGITLADSESPIQPIAYLDSCYDDYMAGNETIESIAKKIHEIYCCDKNLLIEKAEKAYSYYLQTFTVEKMQRKMKQILEQLE